MQPQQDHLDEVRELRWALKEARRFRVIAAEQDVSPDGLLRELYKKWEMEAREAVENGATLNITIDLVPGASRLPGSGSWE